MKNYKLLFAVVTLFFFSNAVIAQDVSNQNVSPSKTEYYRYFDIIKLNGFPELRIKIINIDNEYVTYFLPSDSTKTIKQIPRQDIMYYKYLSIEDNLNTSVINRDRVLYLAFLDDKLKRKEIQAFKQREDKELGINYIPSEEFYKASGNLTLAGILIVGGGVFHLLASSNLSASSNLTDELNSRYTMAKIGNAMLCGAGVFLISASVNVRNGAVNLK